MERAYDELLMDKLDAIQRRLDRNEHIPNEETVKLAESRSTCEECGEFDHVSMDCPKDAKVLSYVESQGWKPPYQPSKCSFTPVSSMQNAIPFVFNSKTFSKLKRRSSRTLKPNSKKLIIFLRGLMTR